MIRTTFFFILFLVFSIATPYAGQGSSEDKKVLFVGVKARYMDPTSIHYSIQNNSSRKLFFYCNVEKKIRNEWKEFHSPITNTLRGVKYEEKHPLAIGETKSLSWIPRGPGNNWRYPAGTYRFNAVLRDANQYRSVIKSRARIDASIIATIYSDDFRIEYSADDGKSKWVGEGWKE